MALQKIIRDNYDSIVKRGLISPNTKPRDFLEKLYEECNEFETALLTGTNTEMDEELADVILVCLNFAQHYDIDIENELTKKIKKNYERSRGNT